MKASDYIVSYLVQKQITDVFGYPGGMVTHLMDSFYRNTDKIRAHTTYHEQGAAMAACGYAQTSGSVGVAFATSGPGATNLLTGICNAWFDSIPVLFITGQVNTKESAHGCPIRQRGFQETDVVALVNSVTKYAAYVECANDLRMHLDRAFFEAEHGRKGPVLLDIPMDVQRADIDPVQLVGYEPPHLEPVTDRFVFSATVIKALNEAERPCLIVGNGARSIGAAKILCQLVTDLRIPTVSSMLAVDMFSVETSAYDFYYGFLGAYGNRSANFVVAKSDLIIAIGSRLDVRQVGGIRESFAPESKIIRVDIDPGELAYAVRDDECFCMDATEALQVLLNDCKGFEVPETWIRVCKQIKSKLDGLDEQVPNNMVRALSQLIPDGTVITTDVGQNQVWVAQSFLFKEHQSVLFSGGHAAMGYSLPAAIGAYYGGNCPVFSVNGDGGIQMNIQELQYISREKLPIKIIVLNNHALGMIRHFQEMYFESRYSLTVSSEGYSAPDFCAVAEAYKIPAVRIHNEAELNKINFHEPSPLLIDIVLDGDTYVLPKLEFGKPNQDQQPCIDRDLYQELMAL